VYNAPQCVDHYGSTHRYRWISETARETDVSKCLLGIAPPGASEKHFLSPWQILHLKLAALASAISAGAILNSFRNVQPTGPKV
jgi:hypothetical protein